MEIKANGDCSSDTTCRIETMSRGGRLDYLPNKNLAFAQFEVLADFSNIAQVKQSTYTCKSKSIAAECKTLHMKVKGGVWREQTQCRCRDFFRGSDRWCYRTSTLMETSTHEG